MANLHDIAKKHQLKIPQKTDEKPIIPVTTGTKRRPWNTTEPNNNNSEPERSQIRVNSEPNQSQNEAKSELEQSQAEAGETKGDGQFGARIGARSEPKRSQNRAKTEPGSEPSLSSSSYLNTNSKPTTTEVMRARLQEWTTEDLDYSMLTDIGFGRSQVMQLRSLGISFDVLQRSLVHFDFELRFTESGKSIKEPLALLMKRLRQNGCWEAPEEYQKRIKHFQTQFEERERELRTMQPSQPQDVNQSDTAM